jgi:thiamine biosynthesis lipoprotein
MDTVVSVKIYGKNKNYLYDIIDKTFEKMKNMEILLNNYDNRSDIYKININSGKHPVKVDKITIDFLNKAVKLCRDTDGFLDISIGKVLNLWGFATANPHVPLKANLKKALELKGLEHIKIYNNDNRVFVDKKGVFIDVGAVAKGYIIEKMIKFLSDKVEKGVINAGGDIKFIGMKDRNSYWKVGIKNPFSSNEGDVVKTVEVGSWSIVTSGDYERFFIKNGKKYHHIINPFSGMPSNLVHSVTVCTDNAFIADGLATAIFVMGDELFLKKYYKKFKKLKHFRVIIIKNKNKIIDTKNL